MSVSSKVRVAAGWSLLFLLFACGAQQRADGTPIVATQVADDANAVIDAAADGAAETSARDAARAPDPVAIRAGVVAKLQAWLAPYPSMIHRDHHPAEAFGLTLRSPLAKVRQSFSVGPPDCVRARARAVCPKRTFAAKLAAAGEQDPLLTIYGRFFDGTLVGVYGEIAAQRAQIPRGFFSTPEEQPFLVDAFDAVMVEWFGEPSAREAPVPGKYTVSYGALAITFEQYYSPVVFDLEDPTAAENAEYTKESTTFGDAH